MQDKSVAALHSASKPVLAPLLPSSLLQQLWIAGRTTAKLNGKQVIEIDED
jgi:hypothetical protein